MRIYRCVVDAGHDVYAMNTCADSKRKAVEKFLGNGEVVKVSDVTTDVFNRRSLQRLYKTLVDAGWDSLEAEYIQKLLARAIAHGKSEAR